MLAEGISLLGAGISMLAVLVVGSVKGDEMSEIHTLKAKSRTYDCILIALLLFSLIGSVLNLAKYPFFITNWQAWLMMLIGVMQFISGFFFAKYEGVGD